MIDFLPYIVKSGLSFAIFYAFFALLLRKESSLKFNRFYLVGTAIISIVAPLLTLDLTAFGLGQVAAQSVDTEMITATTGTYVLMDYVEQKASFNWSNFFSNLVIGIYLSIAGLLLIRFLLNLSRLAFNILKGERLSLQKLTLVLNQNEITPHTFLKFIFLNKQMFQEGAIEQDVIEHERAHVEQLHSLDILLIEIVKIVFWFNPFVWMYKNDIQLNHEYLADQAVLKQTPITAYQTSIIKAIQQSSATNLVSNFNYSSTKKRFIMMTKTKMKKRSYLLRLGLLLPLTMAVFFFSVQLQAQETKSTEKVEKVIKTVKGDDDKAEKEIKVKVISSGDEKMTKEKVAEIKKEIEKAINMQKDLTDEQRTALEKELEELEATLQNANIEREAAGEARERAETERVKVIELRKEKGNEHEKKMIFISEDGSNVRVLGDDDKGSHQRVFISKDGETIDIKGGEGAHKKIIISEDGKDVEIIELVGEKEAEGTKVIFIKNDSEEQVKVIEINKKGYKYEWKSDSDEDFDIEIENIIEDVKKDVKVIINGKQIDLDDKNMLKDLDENIKVIIKETMDDADIEKTIKIIHIDEDEISKTNKKKSKKRK